jgi:hypothetical protein
MKNLNPERSVCATCIGPSSFFHISKVIGAEVLCTVKKALLVLRRKKPVFLKNNCKEERKISGHS